MTTLQSGCTARDLRVAEQSHRLMLSGAIRMPLDLAMQCHIDRVQFYARANQAMDLLEEQDSKLASLKMSLRDILEQLRRESATQVALMRVEGQLHDLLAKMEASSGQ
jgi:hypothetical protein